jgi:ferredoxin
LRYFTPEYETHIVDKKCPAGVCKPLFHYEIDPDECTGCMLCARKCPVEAITGEKKQLHVIDQDKCTKCGTCYEVCRFDAVAIQ